MHRSLLAVFVAFTAVTAAPPSFAADYYVSILLGNDANAGTIAQPLKTITRAFALASSGDRVLVLPGRYAPSAGESFPLTVPAGVTVLGTDARQCVIDAEFDPTATSNPVTGTIVQILERSRFAHLSVVRGARDPSTPSNHWWKIAILVQGQSGNSADVEIDHVLVDEVSRGIVCGYAVGDHDIKNVKIHDCVLTRFYVEAVNSWVNNGTASGNLLYNCTISGHMNPTSRKPYARACVSFNDGSRFDVRNCILLQADWAGLEATAKATITSDHNCYHGGSWTGFTALRGVTQGTNDVFADPMVAALPTVTTVMDPHLTGTQSPAWQKGANQAGQATDTDLDFRAQRIVAGLVDIGADEWTRHDAYFTAPPRPGRSTDIGVIGGAGTTAILVIGFRALASGVNIPGFQGQLWIDPTAPILLVPVLKDVRGHGALPLTVPADNNLIGLELDLQGIDTPLLQLSDLDQAFVLN